MINPKQELVEYLYNRLPKVYRTSDKELVLRRFIETFVEGGYDPLLQDTVNILDLLDVDKCPSRFLPQLCKMYGYEYTLEIPELFQRRLLKYIVEMYKRKGTKSVVKFIARELTGFDSEIIENKDFNEEHIQLTKWDKRFEHYRNFILKLTAPYEDSNLFNKEDIVIRIVNDFLPTNSQVFVITAYWFKEESEIVKKSIEECVYEAVQDYQGSYYSNTVNVSVDEEVGSYLAMQDTEYNWGVYGEEDSYLNYPIEGMTLTTNTVINLRDTITFATELYSEFLSLMESEDLNVLKIADEELITFLTGYNYTESNRISLNVESYNYVSPRDYEMVERNLDVPTLEDITFNKNLEDLQVVKVSDKNIEEVNIPSRTLEVDCGIIKQGIEEYTYNNRQRNLLDNSRLNIGVLFTNGIMCYDIIKEQGKPNRIILL